MALSSFRLRSSCRSDSDVDVAVEPDRDAWSTLRVVLLQVFVVQLSHGPDSMSSRAVRGRVG